MMVEKKRENIWNDEGIEKQNSDILTRTVSFVFRFYLLIHILIKDRVVVYARMNTVTVFHALLRLQGISRWDTVCTDVCLFHFSNTST